MSPPATSPALSTRVGVYAGRSRFMRLQSDERLIALIRAGNEGAFELLFERYRPRLLAFCRHMLASREDAEDVLQDLFTAAYNAIRADNREINVRPWLYRIARNRCLNHLRRPTFDGRDTMDDQVHSNGTSTADVVHRRVDFRHLLDDIQKLPESQRTALLLREMDALSYDQIAEAMDNTVPSVKSLLVRARISLAEAAEARQLSCTDARRQLAEIAEGLRKTSPPLRRHTRACEDCRRFRTEVRKTTTAMALVFPIGILAIFKKLALAKLGAAAAAGGSGAASGGAAAGSLAAGGASTAAGTAAGTGLSCTIGAVATKAIAVTTATALLAGGAVEVRKITTPPHHTPSAQAQQAPTHPPLARRPGSVLPAPAARAGAAKQKHRKSKADATKAAAADSAAVPATSVGATGVTGTTAQGPTSGGVTGGTGSSGATQTETGGASIPPPQAVPPEAAGSEVAPSGPAGGEPPPAPPPPSPAPPPPAG